MESGKLRFRGLLQSPPATLTDRGAVDKSASWTTVATVRVGVTSTAGGEFLRGRQVMAEATHLLTIRYRSDVTPRWRMQIDGVTYHFLAVTPDDRKREIVIQSRVQG